MNAPALLAGAQEPPRLETHGCLRLQGDDFELLFRGVPVGTPAHVF